MPDISIYGQSPQSMQQQAPQSVAPSIQAGQYQPPPQQPGFNAAAMAQALGKGSSPMTQQQPSTQQQWQQFLANYGSATPTQPTQAQLSQTMPWQGGSFGSGGG